MHQTIEVTVPSSETDSFMAEMNGNGHVVGLTLVRGAPVKPAGNVVTVHVLNRGTDDVLRAVARGRQKGATAEIASLSDLDHQHAIDHDIDEATWEELETGLRHQGRITSNYLLLMAVGGIIAAAGVLAEPAVATVAYVASAIIALGFEPVAKIPLGIVLRRGEVLKIGIVSTVAGYAALMLAAAATYWDLHAVGAAEADTFLKSDGLKHTIHPDSLILLIAVCRALAGITMQAAFRRSVIAGALIALRIIETAGIIGIGLAITRFDLVGKASGGWQSMWRSSSGSASLCSA
jgi:hypothetical protein